ncbi:hypothetical protein [Salinithrix halophila]|uniref:hypothetical protein n=1 Tax=Salinithrix halophila TaxID=1485204 RepID=UPI0036D3D7C4
MALGSAGLALALGSAGLALALGSAGLALALGSAGLALALGSAGLALTLGSAGLALALGSAGLALALGSAGLALALGSAGLALALGSAGLALALGSAGLVLGYPLLASRVSEGPMLMTGDPFLPNKEPPSVFSDRRGSRPATGGSPLPGLMTSLGHTGNSLLSWSVEGSQPIVPSRVVGTLRADFSFSRGLLFLRFRWISV